MRQLTLAAQNGRSVNLSTGRDNAGLRLLCQTAPLAEVARYTFDDPKGGDTLSDNAGRSAEDGTYKGDAAADGSGAGSFDGKGDYAEIPADPAFGLDQGTVFMSFTQTAASDGNNPWGNNAAMTLFSSASSGYDCGGHMTIYITKSGEIGVRRQTDSKSFVYKGGQIDLNKPSSVAYSWGPGGSQLAVNGEVVDMGKVPLSLGADTEPITIGVPQAQSGSGTANNLKGFFKGSIDEVRIYDDPAAASAHMVCFASYTMILTVDGPRAVEALGPGDLIVTRDHGPVPLVGVYCRTVGPAQMAAFPNLRPVGLALPDGGFIAVSRQHCLLLRDGAGEVLVCAAHLARFGEPGFRTFLPDGAVTFVHLDLGHHGLVAADGIWAESLLPGGAEGLPTQVPCRPVLDGKAARALVARRGVQFAETAMRAMCAA